MKFCENSHDLRWYVPFIIHKSLSQRLSRQTSIFLNNNVSRYNLNWSAINHYNALIILWEVSHKRHCLKWAKFLGTYCQLISKCLKCCPGTYLWAIPPSSQLSGYVHTSVSACTVVCHLWVWGASQPYQKGQNNQTDIISLSNFQVYLLKDTCMRGLSWSSDLPSLRR